MSYFASVNMSAVKTGTTQKQPVWEPHASLAQLENEEFSFRTISSDFNVGGISYKVSCFQMRSGFFERNSNVQGIVKFAQMLQLVEQGLVDTNLAESFGLDCATFKQDSKEKNASRNLCIYVMPKLPNGVRSYLDALTQDLVKKENTKSVVATTTATKPTTAWAGLNKPTTTAPTTNTVTPPWGAK